MINYFKSRKSKWIIVLCFGVFGFVHTSDTMKNADQSDPLFYVLFFISVAAVFVALENAK